MVVMSENMAHRRKTQRERVEESAQKVDGCCG